MEPQICTQCRKPKAHLKCGICQEFICKNCTHFVDADHFSFRSRIPSELSFTTYCGTCFSHTVEPAMQKLVDMLEQAKNVAMFYKDQGKETRRMSRVEKPLSVDNCLDKNDMILRLAFRAIEAGFNTLVDVDLVSQKVRNGNYQHLVWSGTAVPVSLEPEKLKHK